MSQPPDAAPAAWAERPTWVRWRIVALLMAYSFMTWFNRVSMQVAGTSRLMPDYGLTPTEIGSLSSAFLFAYALFMTPGGWFIDRRGPRLALTVMGFGSALFCALTGRVGQLGLGTGALFLSLWYVRALMGLCTAPVYPASSRTVAYWFPPGRRASVNGLVQGAATIGIACAYPFFGDLIRWCDWPRAFLITGALTAFLALVWALYAADRPQAHPGVNKAELQLIVGPPASRGSPAAESSAPAIWARLLQNRSLMFLTVSYAAVGYFEYLFFFWMGYYFKDILQLPERVSEFYAGIPPLGMAVGIPLGGWLSDRLQRALGHRRGLAIVPVGGLLGGAALLGLGILATDPRWVVTWFALALGVVGACEGPVWATAVELGGRRGATAAGICNTGGNLGGILAPVVTPWFSELCKNWAAGIGLGSGVCLVGAVLWWWIDPAERLPEDRAPEVPTAPATRGG
jgi:sugar phosphate permease